MLGGRSGSARLVKVGLAPFAVESFRIGRAYEPILVPGIALTGGA